MSKFVSDGRKRPPLSRAILTALGLAALGLAASASASAGATPWSPGPPAAPTDPSTGASPSAPLSAADEALVRRAEAYLQSLHAAQGRFTQTDAKGRVTTGAFAFERPGRARFAYDGPKGLLVVSDGDTVSVYDRALKSFDQYPLEQTPLVILLGDKVRLQGAIAVTSVTRSPRGFVVEARDARHKAPGRLALTFSEAPLTLAGWSITDAQNQRTTVTLTRLERKRALPDALFAMRPPNSDGGTP